MQFGNDPYGKANVPTPTPYSKLKHMSIEINFRLTHKIPT
jgi:hypothetical protein